MREAMLLGRTRAGPVWRPVAKHVLSLLRLGINAIMRRVMPAGAMLVAVEAFEAHCVEVSLPEMRIAEGTWCRQRGLQRADAAEVVVVDLADELSRGMTWHAQCVQRDDAHPGGRSRPSRKRGGLVWLLQHVNI